MSPSDSNRVVIFDTTLRDGEQSPGASMNLEEKLRIAQVLEEMGVDVIEAGFPMSSRGDIEQVAEAIEPAPRGRIHTFISTSPLHMKYKLQLEPDQVYERIVESVS